MQQFLSSLDMIDIQRLVYSNFYADKKVYLNLKVQKHAFS